MGGLIYAPVLHYYGRTDSLQSSALLPTIYIVFDSVGLYVKLPPVFFISDKNANTYLCRLLLPKQVINLAKKVKRVLAGMFMRINFFYNTIQLPQSALKEQAGTNLYYLSKYINFSGSGSLAFF